MKMSQAVLDILFANIKTTFQNAFNAAPSQWEKIAMKVTSTGRENEYKWLSNFPMMREWIGDKVCKALSAFGYTIKNKSWESTIEVDRNDIKDDQMGGYAVQAQQAGVAAKKLPDQIVFRLVNDGFTSKCFDGQNYFDTDHPVTNPDGTVGSVSNKITKKFDISTMAKARASFGLASTMMREFKDDDGESLDLMPTILLVPPALKDDAITLATAEKINDETNIYRGTIEVVVSSRLRSRTAWYLFDASQPVKPIIYQEREAPGFVQQTGMDSDAVFMNGKLKFGVEARGDGGYGFWQMGVGSTGTEA